MDNAQPFDRPGPRPAIVWATVLAAAFAVRFPSLGLQSPWLDEINNWLTSSEMGLALPRRTHVLTYFFQALGLRLSDSTWGLRLSSAVIGFAAVVALTQFLLSRFGSRAALVGGALFAVQPFAVFYSQDANHYAPMMLSGVLAAFAVSWFLDRPDPKPLAAAGALGATVLALGFHPVGLLPALGGFACLFAWVLIHPQSVPPRSLGPAAKRGTMVVLAVIAAAVVLSLQAVRQRLSAGNFAFVPGTRTPGLNWPFWSALLADLVSTPFIHSTADVAVGVIGAALAIAGWVWAWRAGRRWAAAGAACVAMATVVPFLFINLGHFFYPKFVAPLAPLLACGIGLAAEGALRNRRAPWAMAVMGFWGVWMVMLAVRGWQWQWSRGDLNHQPTYQVLRAIREKTPDGITVATRNGYSSRAFAFLWHRAEMGTRRHVALTADEMAAGPAIQQLQEIAWEAPQPPLFLSLLESREHYAEDFDRFLRFGTRTVANFPSSAPDDFVPFDRSITIRLVPRPDEDPLLLPRSGARMSGVLDELRTRPAFADGTIGLALPLGSGARWRFRLAEPADGVALEYLWDAGGTRPDYMILSLDEQRVFAFPCADAASNGALRIPGPFDADTTHTLDLMMVNRNQNWASARQAGLVPLRLRAATTLDTVEPREATLVAAEETAPPPKQTLEELRARQGDWPTVALPAAPGGTFIAIVPMEVGGLPNRGVATVLDFGNRRVALWRVLGWTQGPVLTGALFDAPEAASNPTIQIYENARPHGQERDPWFRRGAVRVYRLEE